MHLRYEIAIIELEGVEEPISTIECNREEGNFINENDQAFASAQRCIIGSKEKLKKARSGTQSFSLPR